MKKNKYKTKHIYLELFDADFLFVQCEVEHILDAVKSIISKDRVTEFKEKSDEYEIKSTTRGRTVYMAGGGSVIWLRKADPIVMLHEVVHAVNHLLKDRGMALVEETDELYAYTISWLYKKTL